MQQWLGQGPSTWNSLTLFRAQSQPEAALKKKPVTRKIMKIKKNVKEREVNIILSGKFINILEIMQLPDICFVI